MDALKIGSLMNMVNESLEGYLHLKVRYVVKENWNAKRRVISMIAE